MKASIGGLTKPAPIKPIKNILDAVRDGTDIKVIHTRECQY
ncbi:MAG: hypothetical protein VB584_02085 [Candidatus Nitrosopelagicus sp.]